MIAATLVMVACPAYESAGAPHRAWRSTGSGIMNALLRFAAAGVAVAGLTACAGTQQFAVADAAPAARPATSQAMGDAEYVATVEYIARRRGVEVHWVNPPSRRVPPSNQ